MLNDVQKDFVKKAEELAQHLCMEVHSRRPEAAVIGLAFVIAMDKITDAITPDNPESEGLVKELVDNMLKSFLLSSAEMVAGKFGLSGVNKLVFVGDEICRMADMPTILRARAALLKDAVDRIPEQADRAEAVGMLTQILSAGLQGTSPVQ